MARAARAPPAAVLLTARTSIGLLLGTEEDWPTAFEALVERLAPVRTAARRTCSSTERIVNEPFDLRYEPRYALVIDRLALVVLPRRASG